MQRFDGPTDLVNNAIDVALAHDLQDRLVEEFLHIPSRREFLERMHDEANGVF